MSTPEQRLKRGKSLFEYRDCAGVVEILDELAVPGQLADEHEQADVHRMLGICYALSENRRLAAREFSSLLAIEPDYQLDTFEVPPPIVELFEAQKELMKARLDEIRKARERARQAELPEGGIVIERTRTVRVSSPFTPFLPFGLAQFANGQNIAGTVFAATEGTLLLVNIVGFWGSVVVQEGRKDDDGFTAEEFELQRAFYIAHVVAGAGLVVAVLVGFGEALWHREEQALLAEKETRRPLTKGEIKRLQQGRAPEAPAPMEPTPAPPPQ